jgi:hypothetical protein
MMRRAITILTLSFILVFSFTTTSSSAATNAALSPPMIAGNTNCSASSSNTTFELTFISYGNWTALSSQNDNPTQHLESVSFAVSNAANSVSTVCAFSLSDNPGALKFEDGFPLSVLPPWNYAAAAGVSDSDSGSGSGMSRRGKGDATEAACADRKETDGKHRFTIATEAAFGQVERSLAVNQTWFCHDDAGRL